MRVNDVSYQKVASLLGHPACYNIQESVGVSYDRYWRGTTPFDIYFIVLYTKIQVYEIR